MVDAGAARRRPPVGALHLAASRRSHRTVRHRRPAGRPDDRSSAAVADVRDAVERAAGRRARCRRTPTFFEVTTAVAFELFRRAGRRGRGLRSRARRPARRHQRPRAGRDRASRRSGSTTSSTSVTRSPTIAGEKAGIIKPGVPVVVGRLGTRAAVARRGETRRARQRSRRTDRSTPTGGRRIGCARRRATTARRARAGRRSPGRQRGRRRARPRSCSTRTACRVAAGGDRDGARASRRGRDGSTCAACPTAAKCCSTPRTTPPARWRCAPYLRERRRRGRSCSPRCATRTSTACSRRCARRRAPLVVTRASQRAVARPVGARRARPRASHPSAADRRRADAPARRSRRLAPLAAHRRRRIDLPARRRHEGTAMARDTLGPCALSLDAHRCAVLAAADARRAAQPRPPAPAASPADASICSDAGASINENDLPLHRRRRDGATDDTKLYADEVEVLRRRESRRRHRQRRLHPGQQPDRRRPRRVQHQDAARHLLQRQRASPPSSRRGSRRRRPAASSRRRSTGQDTDVYFFGETVEKIGPKKYKITNGGFTTCVQPTPRWDLNAGTIVLNIDHYTLLRERDASTSRACRCFYLPVLYYPTKEEDRATGFLLPTYGVDAASRAVNSATRSSGRSTAARTRRSCTTGSRRPARAGQRVPLQR